MAKNLIIFDIDGTMTESENHHLSAFEYALREMGIHNINTDWASYRHITDKHVLGVNFERQFNEKLSSSDMKDCERLILSKLESMPIIAGKPGASELVNALWNHDGWDLAFATGSLFLPAIKKLRDAEIRFKPSIVIGSNELSTREDLIAAAIDAAKKLNHVTHYHSILSCGDGLWDWQTAQNSDLQFLGVGNHHKEELIAAGVEHHIDDWQGMTPEQLIPYTKVNINTTA